MDLVKFLLRSLVTSCITSGADPSDVIVAAARGTSLHIFDSIDPHERSVPRWNVELLSWLGGSADLPSNSDHAASIAALTKIPTSLPLSRVTFVTRYGSDSCSAQSIRSALEIHEENRPECPVELLCIAASCSTSRRLISGLKLVAKA